MNRLQRGLLLLIGALILSACSRGQAASPATTQTLAVQRGTLRMVASGSGQLQPARSLELAFGSSGVVDAVLVAEGETVTQNQELARLDQRGLEAEVAIAEAQLDQARAQLEKQQAAPTPSEFDIDAAEASVKQSEARLTAATLNLERAVLRAPFGGLITRLNLTAGASAPAGASGGAATLIDPQLHGEVNISEAEIAQVRDGQSVLLAVDALGTTPISGTVAKIAPSATVVQNFTTYRVWIDLAAPPAALRPGMTIAAEIAVLDKPGVLLIPNSAIATRNGQQIVRLRQDTGFVEQPIQTGLSNDLETEVTSGLSEGQIIAEIGLGPVGPGASQ